MRKIEHLGIAVADLKKSNELFQRLLGNAPYKSETVASEGVETSFFQVGDTKIELLQASTEDSPIAKFISKKSEGIHHIAFDVDDIELAFTTIKENHFTILEKEPVFLNFWNKGCKYFNILGPDGERLEFNEIIK